MIARTLAAVLLAVVATLAATVAPARAALGPDVLPPTARLVQDRADFLRLASEGVDRAYLYWWNSRQRWFNERLDNGWNPTMPLVRLWSAYPLYEAVNALALAEPTAARRAVVRAFAAGGERYWNPDRRAYAYYPGHRGPKQTFFDDNGWWGIAALDAFRATGDPIYLGSAKRALRFIVEDGWEPLVGGVWWETSHKNKRTAEPLAAGAYIGAVLYRLTGETYYLQEAQKLVTWADLNTWNGERNLYGRNDIDDTVMDYVQGMMIGAHLELCAALSNPALCAHAQALGEASLVAFPAEADWTPVADTIYLRFMLDLYRYDGDPRWYALAYWNARRALANAPGRNGLYVRTWDGKRGAGTLRDHAATTQLFAWLAATPPPGFLPPTRRR